MVGQQLVVSEVSLSFGGLKVLDNVSLTVDPGAVVGLVGPNGAGKTSLLNCISGVYRPSTGRIHYGDRDLRSLRPPKRAALGIARTFQHPQLVAEMTVLENIMLGRHIFSKVGVVASLAYGRRARRFEDRSREAVEEVIDFLDIVPLRDRHAGQLSAGQRKVVEIARALAMEPSVLLLDEVAAGMGREEKEEVARAIVAIRTRREISQVIIEHDLGFVRDLCEKVVFLDYGQVLTAGTPAEVFGDDAVVAAYLGTRPEA